MKVDPMFGSDLRMISPSNYVTICLHITSPKPIPWVFIWY